MTVFSALEKLPFPHRTAAGKVQRAVPIHLTYFTVWVGDNGKAVFHKDIYKHDRLVGGILLRRV